MDTEEPPTEQDQGAKSTWTFSEWASANSLQEFANLVTEADLATFVEGGETPLTLFAPTNEAIRAVAHKLPGDVQLLRELVCVHITLGSLRWARARTNACLLYTSPSPRD